MTKTIYKVIEGVKDQLESELNKLHADDLWWIHSHSTVVIDGVPVNTVVMARAELVKASEKVSSSNVSSITAV